MMRVMVLLSCDACSKYHEHTSGFNARDLELLSRRVDQLRCRARRLGWETDLNDRHHYCASCWHELASFTEPLSSPSSGET
jgi:hypothetical protein